MSEAEKADLPLKELRTLPLEYNLHNTRGSQTVMPVFFISRDLQAGHVKISQFHYNIAEGVVIFQFSPHIYQQSSSLKKGMYEYSCQVNLRSLLCSHWRTAFCSAQQLS